MPDCLLALESSCDETAAAICTLEGELIASRIASQIEIHRPYGGVVPEVASRNHILHVRPLVQQVLADAGKTLGDMSAFAATSGPGLVSSLLIGTSMAKALAIAENKPFIAVNHMEGHLLSPFMNGQGPVRACVALIVSGGHTMLVRVHGVGRYELLGRTRDDAAGEAFDKVAKMMGLPYPGGPEIDKLATRGDPKAFAFPRSFLDGRSLEFSFSGLKTAVLYELPRGDLKSEQVLTDLSASVQAAIIEVLVEKLVLAAKQCGETLVTVSGGVSCNRGLRSALTARCSKEGLQLLLARPDLCTDNAGMIAFAAAQRFSIGHTSPLEADVDPNLSLVS
ncbi:MAG: tRNA (adenosine(37)-N6)-threonylcarbamoyltransferase complex transferase subunit TsaD [Prosthecobacter sp.]|uniref:tRNA (adenosine(37)-N6)-threonylcarbamoyltransferase complex transferase subunit TsaD n=1 Tax=Prosthecobacter sp. TaxID=1965333 RepID=UPI0025EA2847|nr:tRNA (adenosine(37)-N6)-threonylcarbamoyltransferase complex transferase subunit TsaD [Prosthecobacter sp.]MCF7786658.1 tRNA (adenosine(37)-N6)-threonylcarbamoyltransferase complex transferase subunit TsaD [Prosthecobacter sp.]